MSDDLTAAEQARAARWAADWLNDAGWMSQFASASGAVDALKRRADEMDPPETVESLRAERDEALRANQRFEGVEGDNPGRYGYVDFDLGASEARSLAAALLAAADASEATA